VVSGVGERRGLARRITRIIFDSQRDNGDFPMTIRKRLLLGAALLTTAPLGALAHAATVNTATGTEGTDVSEVVVTAERNAASTAAPSKASLLETQPQSIITHQYIEQSTPESGDYTTAVLIAPSVSGVSSNGGGVGDTNTTILRGFQDGQYNVTYDGIAFGDANDTTHHPMAFFPSSTLGATVVDRGPGAAGDLGQANFGGAIHLFSPTVSNVFGASQKITYGSFNTQSYVSTLQTGSIAALHDAKLMISLDERSSDGELSHAGGVGFNQMAKLVVPVTDHLQVTAFTSFNYIRYYQDDNGAGMGMGVTPQQLALYGKNFQLNNDPYDEHYYKYNWVKKRTNFSYFDVKWDAGNGLTIEDQPYYYYYSNHTESAQCSADPVSTTPGPVASPCSATFSGAATDIGGYHKLNAYETTGNVFRINQDTPYGTLRAGGLVESSWAHRFIINYDLTTGQPDPGYQVNSIPSDISYYEPSRWFQYQLFADFQWKPTDQLTITPGIKYIDYKRSINAIESNSSEYFYPKFSQTYTKPLYFITANYRITHNWSIYAQGATSFLIPPVKTLGKFPGSANASDQPQKSQTVQVGTVYTAGPVTLDFDYYRIHASNILQSDGSCQCYVNIGTGDYSGVEAEGAYAFADGFTLFANGSVNDAKTVKPSPGPISNSPIGTAAVGLVYAKGPWMASVSDKYIGHQIGSDGATNLNGYHTVDLSASYDFGKFKLKLAVFNLADQRAETDFDGTYEVFQVGRQIQGTLEAKF
jgi:iron complex outermembrane receptor protein